MSFFGKSRETPVIANCICTESNIFGIVTGINRYPLDKRFCSIDVRFTNLCNEFRGTGRIQITNASARRLRIGSVLNLNAPDPE